MSYKPFEGFAPEGLEDCFQWNEEMFGSVSKSSAAVMRTTAHCGSAIMELMSHRQKAVAEWPTRLATCSTYQDLIELQRSFYEDMFYDYRNHIERVVQIMSSLPEAAQAVMESTHDQARDPADEIHEPGELKKIIDV